MNRTIAPVIITFFSLSFCLFFSLQAAAQQSFFNVPSSEKTTKGTHFFQEQINLTDKGDWTSNATYDFGVGERVELGLNFLGISDKTPEDGGQSPDLMVNSQIFFDFLWDSQVSVGGQVGVSLAERKEFAFYMFMNWRKEWLDQNLITVFGVFEANHPYLEFGKGSWHAGIELPVFKKKLHGIVDYVAGNTSSSVGVLGLSYFFSHQAMLSLGYQFPSPESKNSVGWVFELTLVEL